MSLIDVMMESMENSISTPQQIVDEALRSGAQARQLVEAAVEQDQAQTLYAKMQAAGVSDVRGMIQLLRSDPRHIKAADLVAVWPKNMRPALSATQSLMQPWYQTLRQSNLRKGSKVYGTRPSNAYNAYQQLKGFRSGVVEWIADRVNGKLREVEGQLLVVTKREDKDWTKYRETRGRYGHPQTSVSYEVATLPALPTAGLNPQPARYFGMSLNPAEYRAWAKKPTVPTKVQTVLGGFSPYGRRVDAKSLPPQLRQLYLDALSPKERADVMSELI